MSVGYRRFDDPISSADARPGFDPWLLHRLLAGMSPQALAIAGGISRRTAYRWKREVVALEDVQVGEYVATYAIRRTKPPIRVSTWRAP